MRRGVPRRCSVAWRGVDLRSQILDCFQLFVFFLDARLCCTVDTQSIRVCLEPPAEAVHPFIATVPLFGRSIPSHLARFIAHVPFDQRMRMDKAQVKIEDEGELAGQEKGAVPLEPARPLWSTHTLHPDSMGTMRVSELSKPRPK